MTRPVSAANGTLTCLGLAVGIKGLAGGSNGLGDPHCDGQASSEQSGLWDQGRSLGICKLGSMGNSSVV